MIMAVRLILIAVMIVPILFLLFAHWKGWVSREMSENFVFGVVSFVAIVQIAETIQFARMHGRWVNASALVAALAAMWLAVWLGRKKDKLNNPVQAAVLVGYIAVSLAQNL